MRTPSFRFIRKAPFPSMLKTCLASLGLALTLTHVRGQAGALDTGFDPGTGASSTVLSTAVQADGKIIIGGGFTSFNGTGGNCIARLNPDGSLDTSFNPGPGTDGPVFTTALQADGKLIIGGGFTTYNGTARNFIARLNTNGSLDTGFDPGAATATTVRSTSVQADGKVLIGFGSGNCIARLNADGSSDTGFNPGTGASSFVLSIAVQADGKILVAGNFTSFNGTGRNRIARLNADGSLDTGFDPGTGANSLIRSTAVQADGKILIAGDFTSYNGIARNHIARLNADGTLDLGFNPGTGANSSVQTITVQADGKILIGGDFTGYNGTGRNRIARLNADGSLDTSFNSGTGTNATVFTTAVQADGKIIIGGEFTSYNGTERTRIARLLGCQTGNACDDGSACTVGDVYDANCNCAGTLQDTDNDGTADCNDGCPNDPLKISPGICGCGVADCPVGTVTISVQDEFTFFAPGNPLVAGAYVMIYDPVTLVVLADGVTGPSGMITFTGVPAGAIRYAASAPNHASSSLLSAVSANQSSTLSIFLPNASPVPDPPFYVDADGDGYPASQNGGSPSYDCNDNDPSVHPGAVEICGDGVDNDCDGVADEVHTSYADVDGDGFGDAAVDSTACSVPSGYVTNSADLCPNDPLKTSPGSCGCGTPETDTDNDGTADCIDGCPNDALKTAPGICGCGVVDDPTDTDNDGIADCVDTCPTVQGQVGSACDDGDPDTNLSQLNASCTCEAVPEIGDYRSVTSGSWSSPGSWEVYNGSAFVPTNTPPDQSSGWITIRNGHSITIASPVTVDQVVVRTGGTLAISSTLDLGNGPGDDLRVSGSLSLNSTLNGPGSVGVRAGGLFTVTGGLIGASAVVNVNAGGTMVKAGTSFVLYGGIINNAGTFNMDGGRLQSSGSGPRQFNNLAGGVLDLNNWSNENFGFLTIKVTNAGTINKFAGSLAKFSFSSGEYKNLPGGVVNVHSGWLHISAFGSTPAQTDQYGTFFTAPGTTLQVGGSLGFRFLGTEITNNGSLGPDQTHFLGNSPQALNGTGTIPKLTINAPGGVTLGGTQTVTTSLTLSNGTITLGNNDLILDGASLTGGSESSYMITNGTGSLRRTVPAGGSSYFPVGTSTSFAPATINLDGSGTTDAYRVRVNSGVSTTYDPSDAPTGTPITSAALQHTWFVRDLVNGGTTATLQVQWNAQDEAPGFTRNACRIARNDGSAWDSPTDGPAGGTGPFTLQRSGITDLGPFTVLGGIIDLCPNGPEPGTPCDDANACTSNDVIGADCLCTGIITDTDGDGVCDANDGCPNDPLKTTAGACGCGVADADSDNDGTADCIDACPTDPLKTVAGICGCGTPDTDTDTDGTADCNDDCPNDPLKTNAGICGCGTPDTDTDNDGTADCNDGCPNDPLKTNAGSCGCGTPDTDSDGDGPADCNDGCPNDPLKTNAGICGCGTPDIDTDNDGTADCNDACPNDPLKTAAGICGCGTPDTDSDGDGTADCIDACPNDPLKTTAGICGCGTPDTDTDNDGTADCNDVCPNDPLKIAAGLCGCGTPDTDSDGDGTVDCIDACPNDPLKTGPGGCGCGVADTPATWYADSDGDGFGDAAVSLPGLACLQPQGYVGNAIDCNDTDASINPMAYDACPDGIDNNCNGLIDEQSALIGDVCSSSVGSCQPGVWTCVNNVLTCVGGVLPGPELCSDGLDNDCDGEVDEQGPDTQPLTWFLDADADGHGDPEPSLIVLSCDVQPGYALVGGDCDDSDPAVHPGATEVCNTIDDDCDGTVDEGTVLAWYFDEDGDGFGDDNNILLACTQPNGYVAQPGDCDDLIPTTYPGAPETCNGTDDDCDGLIDGDDPNASMTVWYIDNDGDGYGITGITVNACDPPAGYAAQPGDCNDNDPSVHPNAPDVCVNGIDNNCNGAIDEGSSILGQPCSAGACVPASWGCVSGVLTCITGTGPAVEICSDGIDNDCDGAIDEEDPNSVPQTWYLDGDNDGYGDPGQSTQSCFSVAGHVLTGGDCNDANAAINPGVVDICDGIDNNCDGLVDVGTGQTWYLDADGDGFADGAISIVACAPPVGYTNLLGDCNDNNASINPGAYDACPDGIDNNCNGLFDEQAALIGQPCGAEVGACQLGVWTCVNNVLTCEGVVLPGPEICSDGLDNDCDGEVDEITPETIPLTWYIDVDGDGFGDPDTSQVVLSCDTQPGYAVNAGDCNDNDAAINPAATEACNGIDDDCDGQVDEGCSCSPADIALMLAGTQPTQACFQDCYSGQPNNVVSCITNCYVQAGFSSTCATCVVEYQLCTATSCPECQTDPNSPACIQCRQAAGCDAAFMACSGLQDADGDGEFAPFDCNDNSAVVNSYGVEGCATDGLDNDCDGQVDEDALVDADNDGYTLCDGDCNDLNPDVNPGASEVCDGSDNNCSGVVDEGFPVHYLDNDGDGFGDPNVLGACGAVGSVPNALDCDDTDPSVYTGAPELCDGLDNDCNGIVDDNLAEDLDSDGFTPCTGDCDDQDATVFPGAPELCDGLDNDCNGSIEPQLYADADQDGYGEVGNPVPCGTPGSTNQLDCDDSDPLVTLAPQWFPDADGDGYGVFAIPVVACTQPSGYAGNSFDCNDNDALVFPGQGCTECSPADLALMASDPLVTSPSLQCLQDCSNATDQQQCISNCIADNGLSGPCADCFSAYQFCLQASCPICQEQPESPACIACQANSGCKEAFMACSGLEDADEDGYFAPFDCNDLNAAVHPDAPELCDGLDNDCNGTVDEFCDVRITVKVMLDGPYDAATGSMSDGMRALGLVPTTEPYTGLGYVHVGGGGETTTPAVLAGTGDDAVVDWVVLELRDGDDPSLILATRSALVQRDGDVVEVSGDGPVTMPIGAGIYQVAVRHRNHLGCMTNAPLALSPAGSAVDFSLSSTPTFGTNARKSITGTFPVQALWAGDVTFNGQIKYSGSGNDRDPILVTVGSTTPNNVVSNTYSTRDVNMNGQVKYTGIANDRDPILVNIGGTVPTSTRAAQLP